MARPIKKSLHYFPFDVDFYDDFKIMDLMSMYGPIGVTIYQILLCEIYKEGYYLEVPLEKLAIKILRVIGNRWVKEKNFVIQVILSCADIGLLNDALLSQGVITSVGLQRRYSEATVRNKVSKDKYWLIVDENEKSQPLLNAPKTPINVTETPINVTETPINVTETQQKEIKENKIKLNSRDRSFLTQDQYDLLVNEFNKELIDEYVERTKKYKCCSEKMIRKWIEEDTAANIRPSANRKKNNFDQRDYDSLKLEKALLGRNKE